MITLRASLSLPVSLNRLYGNKVTLSRDRRTGRPKYVVQKYLNPPAKKWKETSYDVLKFGCKWPTFPKLRRGRYFVVVSMSAAVSYQGDLDNLWKILIDTVKDVLQIDDYYYHVTPGIKIPVSSIAEQGVSLCVDVIEMANREEVAEVATKLSMAQPYRALLQDLGY